MTKLTSTHDTRDWESLLPELIYLISRKLGDLAYYVCFSAVCKAWRAAAPLSDPPGQLPWLREQSSSDKEFIRFYSITSKKIYTIPFPSHQYSLRSEALHSQQYLLAFCTSELAEMRSMYGRLSTEWASTVLQSLLINPITHKIIPLPDYPGNIIKIGPTGVQNKDIMILATESSPRPKVLRFYKLKDEGWKAVTVTHTIDRACTYYKGMVFVNMDDTGATEVFDPSKNAVAYVVPAPADGVPIKRGWRNCFSYFIESSGELLGVRWRSRVSIAARCGLDVYRLEAGKNNQLRWVKTRDIGDQILIIFPHGGFSFRSSEVGGHKGNYIYYKMLRQNLMRYDIKEERTEEVSLCDFGLWTDARWFVPSF